LSPQDPRAFCFSLFFCLACIRNLVILLFVLLRVDAIDALGLVADVLTYVVECGDAVTGLEEEFGEVACGVAELCGIEFRRTCVFYSVLFGGLIFIVYLCSHEVDIKL